MKTRIFIISVLVGAAILFAACTEKENNNPEPATTRQEQRLAVTYTIDSEPNHVTLKSVEAYRALVSNLVDKTREGCEIGIVLDGVDFRTVATKAIDTVLVSDSLEMVMEWIERMNYCGYEVLVRYDETTGTYHCKAQMPMAPMYRHLWQCDSDDFSIRLIFWDDSTMYTEVIGGDGLEFPGLCINDFSKYKIFRTYDDWEDLYYTHLFMYPPSWSDLIEPDIPDIEEYIYSSGSNIIDTIAPNKVFVRYGGIRMDIYLDYVIYDLLFDILY